MRRAGSLGAHGWPDSADATGKLKGGRYQPRPWARRARSRVQMRSTNGESQAARAALSEISRNRQVQPANLQADRTKGALLGRTGRSALFHQALQTGRPKG